MFETDGQMRAPAAGGIFFPKTAPNLLATGGAPKRQTGSTPRRPLVETAWLKRRPRGPFIIQKPRRGSSPHHQAELEGGGPPFYHAPGTSSKGHLAVGQIRGRDCTIHYGRGGAFSPKRGFGFHLARLKNRRKSRLGRPGVDVPVRLAGTEEKNGGPGPIGASVGVVF